MKTSEFLKLDWRDFGKGLIVAVIAFIANWGQEVFIPNLNISNNLKVMLIGGIAYLLKNFFTEQKEVFSISSIGLPKPRDPKL